MLCNKLVLHKFNFKSQRVSNNWNEKVFLFYLCKFTLLEQIEKYQCDVTLCGTEGDQSGIEGAEKSHNYSHFCFGSSIGHRRVKPGVGRRYTRYGHNIFNSAKLGRMLIS